MPIDPVKYLEELEEGMHVSPLKRTGDKHKPGWVEIRRDMAVHILGRYPQHLLDAKNPNEDDIWRDWKREIFEAITKDTITQAITDVSRVLSGPSVHITTDEDTAEYLETTEFDGMPFLSWVLANVWDPQMVLDPNSYIIAVPMVPDDPAQRSEIVLKVIDCNQIFESTDEVISWLDYSGEYCMIDDFAYYKYRREEYEDEEGEIQVRFIQTWYYEHQTGKPIRQVIGGRKERREDHVVYRSFFEGYVPFANDQILTWLKYKVVEHQTAHPIPEMFEQPCTAIDPVSNTHCRNGKFYLPDNTEKTCSKCSGTGYVSRYRPGDVILKPLPQDEMDSADLIKDLPMVKYNVPPVDSLKALSEAWQESGDRARMALWRVKKLNQAESAERGKIDLEAKHAMIQAIATHIFGVVVPGIIKMIVRLRRPLDFRTAEEQISVTIPQQFELRTETDLLEELKQYRDQEAPVALYSEAVKQFCEKRYTTSPNIKRKIQLVLLLDRMHLYGMGDQNTLTLSGAASIEQQAFSSQVYSIIDEVVFDQGNDVLERPLEWWRNEVNNRLIQPEPVPPTAEALNAGT